MKHLAIIPMRPEFVTQLSVASQHFEYEKRTGTTFMVKHVSGHTEITELASKLSRHMGACHALVGTAAVYCLVAKTAAPVAPH